jgi:hypothetical protein
MLRAMRDVFHVTLSKVLETTMWGVLSGQRPYLISFFVAGLPLRAKLSLGFARTAIQ